MESQGHRRPCSSSRQLSRVGCETLTTVQARGRSIYLVSKVPLDGEQGKAVSGESLETVFMDNVCVCMSVYVYVRVCLTRVCIYVYVHSCTCFLCMEHI